MIPSVPKWIDARAPKVIARITVTSLFLVPHPSAPGLASFYCAVPASGSSMGRRQHYVPQHYLRRFAREDGRLWAYDKTEDRMLGPLDPKNVAHERDFYNLRGETKEGEYDDPELLEKEFARFEQGFDEMIEVALRVASGGGADLEERARMAKTIAFQHLRTRAWRDGAIELAQKLQEGTLNAALELAHRDRGIGEAPPRFGAVVEREEDRGWAFQAQAMFSSDVVNRIALMIHDCIWIIGVNETGVPLLTSDCPIATAQRGDPPPVTYPPAWLGELALDVRVEMVDPVPGGPGTETAYPLTPSHALIALDRVAFAYLASHDGHIYSLQPEDVRRLNEMQVRSSARWLYSNENEFATARVLCDMEPILRDANRSRIKVNIVAPPSAPQ